MAKIVFVCENCETSNDIDLVALASYGFRLQCPTCKKEYIYKPFDEVDERSAKEITEMWQASLTKFTSTMIEMIFWDIKPLEEAIAARERLKKENSLLKTKLLELESQLKMRTADCEYTAASNANR